MDQNKCGVCDDCKHIKVSKMPDFPLTGYQCLAAYVPGREACNGFDDDQPSLEITVDEFNALMKP